MKLQDEGHLSTVKIRLHQFLSKTGVFASKRDVKEAVWAGDITVAGSVVKNIAFQFNPNSKPVHFRGQQLILPSEHRTLILNKPLGVVCSRLNKQERSLGKVSVFSLLNEALSERDHARLLTVGRLDEATTGLLIITTDGQLVHRITSPEFHVNKTYFVNTSQPVAKEGLDRLRQGVEIELEVDGRVELFTTQPAGVEDVDACAYVVTVAEGKKRQIRRMFTAIGHEVIALERISIGALSLDHLDLDYGEFIDISDLNLDTLIQG